MSSHPADRNLLFGFLALQNNFISREDLIAAVSAWLVDKSRPLDAILRERKSLAADEQELVAALVRKHLARHGDDAEQSLAALPKMQGLREQLRQLGDAEVEATLDHVASRPGGADPDPLATLRGGDSPSEDTRFRILRPHAEGGLGQVFVAEDMELHREVALKEIKLLRADDPASRARFVLEAEITGGLEHPGIVPVYGLGQYSDGRPFYAMRFIRGDSLAEAADRFHRAGQAASLPPAYDSVEFRKLLGRFLDVCNAIEYAHSRGVLHRDLKPGNIMLGKYGETLVVDWGLAKAQGKDEQHQQSDEHTLQPRSGSGSSVTLVGSAIGTPAFMPPEQAAGKIDQLGPPADVYSLGATLYYVLTGQPPFGKEAVTIVLRKVQAGDFLPPRAIKPNIPKALEAICLKAMSRRPEDRYVSPQALADDMDRYLADEPIAALAEPLAVRARRWLRKHPGAVAAAAATLLVGITSAIAIAAIVGQKNQQLTTANAAERHAKTEADAKRREAEMAREKETLAREEETRARQQADAARSDLAAASERSQHALYARTVSLAHQEWSAGNITRATDLLNGIDAKARGWEWDFVKRLCYSEELTLRGMPGIPGSVAMTADGQYVLAASMSGAAFGDDPLVRVWRRSDGASIAQYPGGGAISPDGRLIAVFGGANSESVQILDSVTGQQVALLAGHQHGTAQASFSRDGKRLATVGRDARVKVWEIGKEQPIADILEKGRRQMHAVALSDRGDRIAWRRLDDGVLEWRDVAQADKPSHTVNLGPPRRDIPPVFSPDGTRLAVPIDRYIMFYDTTTGKSAGQRFGHTADVTSLDYSHDNRRLVSSSVDMSVRVWSVGQSRELLKLRGHTAGLVYGAFAVRFDPSANWIISGGADKTVKIWDAWANDADPSKAELTVNNSRWLRSPLSHQTDWLAGHTGIVVDVAVSPDDKWIASAGSDGTARLVSTAPAPAGRSDTTRILKHSPALPLSAVEFSPNGSLLATGSGALIGQFATLPGEICVWETATGNKLHHFKELNGPIAKLAFTQHGDRLIAAVGSQIATTGELVAFDLTSNKVAWRAKGVNGTIRDMAIEPGRQWIATVGHDGRIHLWDVATGRRLRSLAGQGQIFFSVAVSPDSKHLAVGGLDWSVRMFQTSDGRELWAQRNHSGAVMDVCFSLDGSRLFSTSNDGTCRVWDPAFGDETLTLQGEGAENCALALRPSGSLLVARSDPEIAVYRVDATRSLDSSSGDSTWPVVFSDRFDRPELGEQWRSKAGAWSIVDGALCGVLKSSGTPGWNHCLLIPKFTAPSFMDLSFDMWSNDPLALETKLRDLPGREGIDALYIGTTDTPFNYKEKGGAILFQPNQDSVQGSTRRQGFDFSPGRKYRVRSVRAGEFWQMWIDGALFLEDRLSARLALPEVHLQVGFGKPDSKICIDNLEIRIPDSALPEQRALVAVAEAFERHTVAPIAIQALTERSDLPANERELALEFARQRLSTPKDQLQPLDQWASNSQADAPRAQSALDWLNAQVWSAGQNLEVDRVRAAIQLRAGQFEAAFTTAKTAADRYRHDQGSFHPRDVAVMTLAAFKSGADAEAKRLASSVRELLRFDRWPKQPQINAWVSELRSAGLLSADSPSTENELLARTWEYARAHHEDSDSRPLIAALSDDARIVLGRAPAGGEHDLAIDKAAYEATTRLWDRGKASPAARLVRESAEALVNGEQAQVDATIVWITPHGRWRFSEHFDFVRAGDAWQVKSQRGWLTAFKVANHEWDAAKDGWEVLDQAVAEAPPNDPLQRCQALARAGRSREGFDIALAWTKAEPTSAVAHALLSSFAYWIGDATTMDSAARRVAQLEPKYTAEPFLRAIAAETQLADSPLTLLGKRLRVPQLFEWVNPQSLSVPGEKLGAWFPDAQSMLIVLSVEKITSVTTMDQFADHFLRVYAPQFGAELVRRRTRTFGQHQTLELDIEGRGYGRALVAKINALASIPTSQQIIIFDDGNRFLVFSLACPSQSLAHRTTELCTILDDLTAPNEKGSNDNEKISNEN